MVKFVNNGTTDAATVTETVQLPAGLTGVSILDASGTAVSGASYNSSTGLVTLPSQATLAAGAEQQYTVALAAAPAQTFPVSSAIASATADGVATNNTANLTTTVTPNADLAVTISGPTVATVGNLVTYTIGTTNNGPSVATNAVVTLQLPTGLTLISANGNANPTKTATNVNGFDTYTFPTTSSLVPGGSVVNYINFAMPNASSGLINGVASVSSGTTDVVASNNTAGITTSIAPATTPTTADLRTSISLAKINGTANSTTPATVAPRCFAHLRCRLPQCRRWHGHGGQPGPQRDAERHAARRAIGEHAANRQLDGPGTRYAVGQHHHLHQCLRERRDVQRHHRPTHLPDHRQCPGADDDQRRLLRKLPGPRGQRHAGTDLAGGKQHVDNVPSSNFSAVSTNISTVYDVVTTLAGPATGQPGATVGYTVTTLNNGPSTASASTTQSVTGLPSGLTASQLTVDGQTGTGHDDHHLPQWRDV